jgi:hypothetical protein
MAGERPTWRRLCQGNSRAIASDLEPWLREKLGLISQKTSWPRRSATPLALGRPLALPRRRPHRDRQQRGRALNPMSSKRLAAPLKEGSMAVPFRRGRLIFQKIWTIFIKLVAPRPAKARGITPQEINGPGPKLRRCRASAVVDRFLIWIWMSCAVRRAVVVSTAQQRVHSG